MSALTEAGYLAQPHTSAGRVPTERAYRLFLQNTETSTPSVAEQQKLARRAAKASSNHEAAQIITKQLSEISGSAGFCVTDGRVHLYNLANVFGAPDFRDPRVANYLAQLLDQLPEWVPRFVGEKEPVSVRIGQENDDWRARQVSVVATRAGETYIGVIGPTRLPYRKLMALFTYAKELLEAK